MNILNWSRYPAYCIPFYVLICYCRFLKQYPQICEDPMSYWDHIETYTPINLLINTRIHSKPTFACFKSWEPLFHLYIIIQNTSIMSSTLRGFRRYRSKCFCYNYPNWHLSILWNMYISDNVAIHNHINYIQKNTICCTMNPTVIT